MQTFVGDLYVRHRNRQSRVNLAIPGNPDIQVFDTLLAIHEHMKDALSRLDFIGLRKMQDHVIKAVPERLVDPDVADPIRVIKRFVLRAEDFLEASRIAATDEFLRHVLDTIHPGIGRPANVDCPFGNGVGTLLRASGQLQCNCHDQSSLCVKTCHLGLLDCHPFARR